MTTILIRADASPSIGTGHAMRCLALAQAWIDDNADVHWLASELLAPTRDRLVAEDLRLTLHNAETPEDDDANRTVSFADRIRADWVVLDGYGFGAAHQRVLKQAGHRVLLVDDNGQATEYTADIVLNQNVCADQGLYTGKLRSAACLIGPRYALLRREFRQAPRAPKAIPPMATNVLVTLGGAGNATVAATCIKAFRRIARRRRLQVRLVLGSAVRPDDVGLELTDDWLTATSHIEDMSAALCWADLAVSAAGSTVYELMGMGVPSLLTVVAENQSPIARTLHEMRVGISLGAGESLTVEAVEQAVENIAADQAMRARMCDKGREVVDGQGALRVRSVMQAGLLRLRPARQEDMRMTWEWANDPEVRAVSFSTAPIPWEDHVRWFETHSWNERHRMYIAERPDGTTVGLVRFDLNGTNAVISVCVDRASRGGGYGTWLIRLGSLEVLRTSGVTEVHALIMPSNTASLRAFDNAGFRFHSHTHVRAKPAQRFVFTQCGV